MQEKKENNLVRWKRVFIDRAALAKYTKGPKLVKNLAGALLNSPGTTDYEPLRRDLASARLNKADRALIIDFEVAGEWTAVIADIAENHDYNKSPLYSDKHGVEKYRAKYGLSIIQRIREQMEEERAAAARQAAGEAITPPYPVVTLDCYNQNFIRLNSQQESLLEAMLPALVSGAPGSGKSCVAISLITEFLSRLSDNPEARILYVTKSPELIEAMQAIWDALLLPEHLKHRVEFKTYETVAREQKSEAFVGKSLARETDFEQWLKDHIPSRLHESRQIYEEFRLLSGYPGEYMGLGVKKSLYHNQADRQWILKTYEAYLAYLEDQHKVALDFLDLKQQGKYDLVLGDEAQDLSGQELVNLLNLAKNGQICFCMDSHQSLFDSKSKRPFIFEMIHRSKLKLEHIELPHSYRCPADVVHFANTVIRIKNTVVGGSSDKLEKPEIKMSSEQAKTPGMVHWLTQDEKELAKLREMAKQSNFAIITLPQYVKEARDKYPGVMIFTPEQIKGLEYENVLLYRMLDDPLCHEASRELDPNAKVPVNRARRGCSKDRFGPPLNKFFTSCTRATRRLFVDQGKGHPLTMLCNELEKGIITPDTAFLSEVILKQTEEERLAGWLEETCRLYRNGRKEMAEEAFNRWLKGNTPHTDYTSFLLANELIKMEEPVKPSETAPAQESEKLLEPASTANEKEDTAPDINTVRGRRNSNKGRRGRQRTNPAGGKPPAATTTASLSKNNVSGGLAGLLPNFFNSNKKSQEKLPISTGGNLGVSRLIDTIKTDLPIDEQTKLMSLFESKDTSPMAMFSEAAPLPSASATKYETTQSDLNRWFEVFSDDWLDHLGEQPEVILELLLLIKNAGYDSFLSRLKSDNDKWMALKRSFTKNPEMTEFYFSLNELIKKEPISGKSYFEILCRQQDGLDFLKEVLESLSVPEMLDKGPLLVLSVIFFGATANTEWDKLCDENNLLMFLLNSPSGRQVFKLIFTSQLFSGLVWKDKASETLLHWAVRNQRINVIVLIMAARDSVLRDGLLKPECDVWSIKNKDGLTPLELAQKNNLSNVIKALDPALYVRSSAKKAEATSHAEAVSRKESINQKMMEIEKTRGVFALPKLNKMSDEIMILSQEKKSIRDKLSSGKFLTQRGLENKKALTRQLKKTEKLIEKKRETFNQHCNEAKLNAAVDLTDTTLNAKEMYEKFELVIIGSVPDLLYCFLISMPVLDRPPLLRCLYEDRLKTNTKDNTWSCLENYLEENQILVDYYFSLEELFKPFEESNKTRFEMLARSEEGLEFLVLIFKNLTISDSMKFDLQDAIGLSFYHDIASKSWGALAESDSLLLYLLNRSQGRYLLSKLPANIFYNLIRQQDSQSNSFLHWAAATQRADLITMALELQPRLKDSGIVQVFAGLKNKEGQTALDIAKANQFEEGITLLTRLEVNQTVQPGLAAYSSLFHPVERSSAETESRAAQHQSFQ